MFPRPRDPGADFERGRPVMVLIRWGTGGIPRNVLIRRERCQAGDSPFLRTAPRCLTRQTGPSVNEHAEHQTLNWISFSNAERLHEQLDDLPPTEYEELNYKTDNNKSLLAA